MRARSSSTSSSVGAADCFLVLVDAMVLTSSVRTVYLNAYSNVRRFVVAAAKVAGATNMQIPPTGGGCNANERSPHSVILEFNAARQEVKCDFLILAGGA